MRSAIAQFAPRSIDRPLKPWDAVIFPRGCIPKRRAYQEAANSLLSFAVGPFQR